MNYKKLDSSGYFYDPISKSLAENKIYFVANLQAQTVVYNVLQKNKLLLLNNFDTGTNPYVNICAIHFNLQVPAALKTIIFNAAGELNKAVNDVLTNIIFTSFSPESDPVQFVDPNPLNDDYIIKDDSVVKMLTFDVNIMRNLILQLMRRLSRFYETKKYKVSEIYTKDYVIISADSGNDIKTSVKLFAIPLNLMPHIVLCSLQDIKTHHPVLYDKFAQECIKLADSPALNKGLTQLNTQLTVKGKQYVMFKESGLILGSQSGLIFHNIILTMFSDMLLPVMEIDTLFYNSSEHYPSAKSALSSSEFKPISVDKKDQQTISVDKGDQQTISDSDKIFYIYTTGLDYGSSLTRWTQYIRDNIIDTILTLYNKIIIHHSDIMFNEPTDADRILRLKTHLLNITNDITHNKVIKSTFTINPIDFSKLHAQHAGQNYIVLDCAHVVQYEYPVDQPNQPYENMVTLKLYGSKEQSTPPFKLFSVYFGLIGNEQQDDASHMIMTGQLFSVDKRGVVTTYIKTLWDKYSKSLMKTPQYPQLIYQPILLACKTQLQDEWRKKYGNLVATVKMPNRGTTTFDDIYVALIRSTPSIITQILRLFTSYVDEMRILHQIYDKMRASFFPKD